MSIRYNKNQLTWHLYLSGPMPVTESLRIWHPSMTVGNQKRKDNILYSGTNRAIHIKEPTNLTSVIVRSYASDRSHQNLTPIDDQERIDNILYSETNRAIHIKRTNWPDICICPVLCQWPKPSGSDTHRWLRATRGGGLSQSAMAQTPLNLALSLSQIWMFELGFRKCKEI